MFALVSIVAWRPGPIARGGRALAKLVGRARQLDVAQARRRAAGPSRGRRGRPARRRRPRCAPRSRRGSARWRRPGSTRSATTASSAARNAAITSSIDDTGYDSGSGLPVEGSIALKDPVGLAGCRHSPAIRTGSSAMMRLTSALLVGVDLPATSFSSVIVVMSSTPPMVMATTSPCVSEKSWPGTMPVPVDRNAPFGKSSSMVQVVGQLVERALDLRRARLARERRAAAARDLEGDRQILQPVGVADVDAGTDRARAVVDLRLRQVERVVALDVARRDVVADGVADDLAGAVDHQRQLRLGHVPGAVVAHADRHVVAGDAPAVRLEEQLGPLRLVDARVDVLDRRLLLARVAAAQVGHARGPHLLRRLDRRQERRAAARRQREVRFGRGSCRNSPELDGRRSAASRTAGVVAVRAARRKE